jgi:hypothetical protein
MTSAGIVNIFTTAHIMIPTTAVKSKMAMEITAAILVQVAIPSKLLMGIVSQLAKFFAENASVNTLRIALPVTRNTTATRKDAHR